MEKEIKKIVLTGGPCAGKTTAMSWIQNHFENQGYKVLFVPEEATELIVGGISPSDASTVNFQSLLTKLQIDKEDAFEYACNFMNYQKYLIVCDRGVIDNRAYMTDQEFNEVLKSNGLTLEEAKERYDAVFHLVSAAKGAEETYNFGNIARTETVEEARILDDKTLRAWIGHSHLRVIDNSTNFEDKMKKLMKEISSVLGIPYPYEIERKFKIDKPNYEFLDGLDNCIKVRIVQTYLLSDDDSELRIRQRGNNGSYSYTMTRKKKLNNLKRVEIEKRLTPEEYISALENIDPTRVPIIKDRYCLCYKNQYFEIDMYPNNSEYAICEIELLDENQEIIFPKFLNVIEEVTDKEEYKNVNIAQKSLKKKL